MINWNKSAELNNTTIDEIKAYCDKYPKCSKKIIVNCNNCGKEREIKKSKYRDLCKSCGCKNRLARSGNDAPNYGKHHSDETRKKIGNSQINKIVSEETREKHRILMLGENNPMFGKLGEAAPNWKGGKVILICQQCGKEFERNLSQKDNAKFCSYECYGKWNSENICGINHPNWKGGLVTKNCEICSKEFKSAPSKNSKFCSKECYNEWMSINKCGDKNSSWNPNITDEDRINGRNILGYKKWRKSIYARDNYTCQHCGDDMGGNLNAHHIESYNNNPDLRTTLSNGITLCKDCHDEFHNQYGRGNNTRSQLNEWILK